MKVELDIDESLQEDSITIHCRELSDEVIELQRQIASYCSGTKRIIAEKNGTEFYLELKDLCFMEADGNYIAIHTATDIYRTKQKLYELEELLPRDFIRVSKSAIINTKQVTAIKKNIAGPSEIAFKGSSKRTYASRNYIRALLEIMDEKRLQK